MINNFVKWLNMIPSYEQWLQEIAESCEEHRQGYEIAELDDDDDE